MGYPVSNHHFKHRQPQEVEEEAIPTLTQSHDYPQVVGVANRFASLGTADSEVRKTEGKTAHIGGKQIIPYIRPEPATAGTSVPEEPDLLLGSNPGDRFDTQLGGSTTHTVDRHGRGQLRGLGLPIVERPTGSRYLGQARYEAYQCVRVVSSTILSEESRPLPTGEVLAFFNTVDCNCIVHPESQGLPP